MAGDDRYTIVVARSHKIFAAWEWEIYRDGEPLPVGLRKDGFKSDWAAKTAGNAALLKFLSALSREQDNPD